MDRTLKFDSARNDIAPLCEIADGLDLDNECGECTLKNNCPGYYDGCFEAVNGQKEEDNPILDDGENGGKPVNREPIIDRRWAMPNKHTFSIAAIRDLIDKYWVDGVNIVSIDPFANESKLAQITNDLDPQYDTDYHMDALDFLAMFGDASVDVVLYDPPYSPRQVSESYRKLGCTVNMATTQSSYWRKHKEQISRIVRPGGIVISCGWNSGGMGAKYGFDPLHIRLVAHGGAHNDTIVVAERRR